MVLNGATRLVNIFHTGPIVGSNENMGDRHGIMNSLDRVEFMENFENIPENNLIISIFGFLRPPTIILGIPDY